MKYHDIFCNGYHSFLWAQNRVHCNDSKLEREMFMKWMRGKSEAEVLSSVE